MTKHPPQKKGGMISRMEASKLMGVFCRKMSDLHSCSVFTIKLTKFTRPAPSTIVPLGLPVDPEEIKEMIALHYWGLYLLRIAAMKFEKQLYQGHLHATVIKGLSMSYGMLQG